MLWWVVPALACTTPPFIEGFEPGLDGAVDIPTDIRPMLLGNMDYLTIQFTSSEGESVSASAQHMHGATTSPFRVAIVPAEPLSPFTEYHIEVYYNVLPPEDPPVLRAQATFTTGAGPANVASAPVLEELLATDWILEEGAWPFGCPVPGPWHRRELTARLGPEPLPPFSYLVLRSQGPGEGADSVLLVGPSTRELAFTQVSHTDLPPTDRDCIEPLLVLPNGQELAGEPWCLPPPEPPSATSSASDTATGTTGDTGLQAPPRPAPPERQGHGCALGGSSSGGTLAGLVLLGALRRRGHRGAPA